MQSLWKLGKGWFSQGSAITSDTGEMTLKNPAKGWEFYLGKDAETAPRLSKGKYLQGEKVTDDFCGLRKERFL